MDSVKEHLPEKQKPETPALYEYTMDIAGTGCCGFHVVNGFQFHAYGKGYDGQPVRLTDFVYSLQKAYLRNAETYDRINREMQANHRHGEPNPYRYWVPAPVRRACMLLFTYNHIDLYRPGAEVLAKQIEEAHFGTMVFGAPARNPNSARIIESVTWSFPFERWDEYVAQIMPPKPQKKEVAL